jgi:hypothetical protein
MKFFEGKGIIMTDDIEPLDEQGLVDAAAKVQQLMMQVAPNPGDGLGVTAMMMTNFLATGLACGILDEDFIDKMINSIRETVNESVAAIYEAMAAEAENATVQ